MEEVLQFSIYKLPLYIQFHIILHGTLMCVIEMKVECINFSVLSCFGQLWLVIGSWILAHLMAPLQLLLDHVPRADSIWG